MNRLKRPALALLLALNACAVARNVPWVSVEGTVTLTPTLSWQPLSELAPGADFTDVTYELRILRSDTGALVYERKGLSGCRHQVEEPLQAATSYQWTVRARFKIGDQERVGPWAATGPSSFVPIPIDSLPSFNTP